MEVVTIKIFSSGAAVLVLSIFHVTYPYLYKKTNKYSDYWVSFSSGIALGYVFLYMFPKLSDYTIQIAQQSTANSWEFISYRIYLFTLIGLVIYLVIDWYSESENKERSIIKLFNYAAFCFYSIILGYILANLPRPGILPIIFITVVLGFHFFGINHQLFKWNHLIFTRYLRWLLAFSIFVGWLYGIFTQLPKEFVMTATAFLSGAIIANVMFEELSKHRPTMKPFLTGVMTIIIIVSVIRSLPKINY
jgi:hypothetical protein